MTLEIDIQTLRVLASQNDAFIVKVYFAKQMLKDNDVLTRGIFKLHL